MRSKLKEARNFLGITQKEISESLGVSERYYRYIESGKRDGTIRLWRSLEEMLGKCQRELQEND